MPTRRRARAGAVAMPCEASSATWAASSTVPAASSGAPARVSSPRRRMCWPRAGGREMRTWPSASSASSCMTTTSAPSGIRLPVNRRMACPGERLGRVAGVAALLHRQARAVAPVGRAQGVAIHRAVVGGECRRSRSGRGPARGRPGRPMRRPRRGLAGRRRWPAGSGRDRNPAWGQLSSRFLKCVAKLQGRWPLSSCSRMMRVQAVSQALLEPGRQNSSVWLA